jgi:hypothetical protein
MKGKVVAYLRYHPSTWRANGLFSRQPAYGLTVSAQRKAGAFEKLTRI